MKANAIQAIDTTNLIEKADYNTKIGEIRKNTFDHEKYITSQYFYKMKTENFSKTLKKQN